jgi:hypothetical protein
MKLEVDAAAQAQIDRVRKHLPSGNDLTLVALKGHLLVEEALDDIIAIGCFQPEHLEKLEIPFRVKPALARALFGHILWPGIWPLVEALNTIRNVLAHNLDSPKLKDRTIRFLKVRCEQAPLLNDPPLDPNDSSAVAERFRSDVSLLLGQLTGGAILIRTLAKQAQPAVSEDASQAVPR